jgi:hypothetical protein
MEDAAEYIPRGGMQWTSLPEKAKPWNSLPPISRRFPPNEDFGEVSGPSAG